MNFEVRAVFFDAGNTLIFPRLEELVEDLKSIGLPATVEHFYAAERFGKRRLDEWLWPQIRRGVVPRTIDHYYWSEYLHELMNQIAAPEGEREVLIKRVAQGFRNIQLWSRVLPDTPPFLDRLRGEGYFLGVISNSVGTMEEQLNRLGLGSYFNAVFDSAIVGVEKPHPEIFYKALERAEVSAAEAIFIGDTYSTDIGGAQLAGLMGVLIDRVGAYAGVTCPCVSSLSELDRVLKHKVAG